jgi:hypothetical protein
LSIVERREDVAADWRAVAADWRAVADERIADERGVTVTEIRAIEVELADAARDTALLALSPLPVTKTSPVERLAAALGWNVKKLYRYLPIMPGVEKLNPSLSKSHYHVPDPADSARRWNSGERRLR